MQSRAHEAPRGEATVLVGADGALRGEREVPERVRGRGRRRPRDFQYWLYKLRRERQAVAREGRVAEVRLVPVTVKARPTVPVRLELRVAGVRLRVPVGADPGYVARLAAALGEARAC